MFFILTLQQIPRHFFQKDGIGKIIAVPEDLDGYETAPMGREEVVIYFDLSERQPESARRLADRLESLTDRTFREREATMPYGAPQRPRSLGLQNPNPNPNILIGRRVWRNIRASSRYPTPSTDS